MNVGERVLVKGPKGSSLRVIKGFFWDQACEDRRGLTGTIVETKPKDGDCKVAIPTVGRDWWFPNWALEPVYATTAAPAPITTSVTDHCSRCGKKTLNPYKGLTLDMKVRTLCEACGNDLASWMSTGVELQVGDLVVLQPGVGHAPAMDKYVGQTSEVIEIHDRGDWSKVYVDITGMNAFWDSRVLRKTAKP